MSFLFWGSPKLDAMPRDYLRRPYWGRVIPCLDLFPGNAAQGAVGISCCKSMLLAHQQLAFYRVSYVLFSRCACEYKMDAMLRYSKTCLSSALAWISFPVSACVCFSRWKQISFAVSLSGRVGSLVNKIYLYIFWGVLIMYWNVWRGNERWQE